MSQKYNYYIGFTENGTHRCMRFKAGDPMRHSFMANTPSSVHHYFSWIRCSGLTVEQLLKNEYAAVTPLTALAKLLLSLEIEE